MHATKKNSYGPQFNAVGGGWYAMERTEQHIKVWYWLRNDPKVPADVRDGKSTINTGAWVSSLPPCLAPSHAFHVIFECVVCGVYGARVLMRGRQGEPVGFWPGGKNCDLTKHLDPHNLVINLTLCGSWAGSTFNADGCPGNCESAYHALPSLFTSVD